MKFSPYIFNATYEFVILSSSLLYVNIVSTPILDIESIPAKLG
jgi:hypothetical protein